MKTTMIPKALEEVWEWKDKCYEESKGMTISEYLKRVHEKIDAIFIKEDHVLLKKYSKKK